MGRLYFSLIDRPVIWKNYRAFDSV